MRKLMMAAMLMLAAGACKSLIRKEGANTAPRPDVPLTFDNKSTESFVLYVQHDGVVSRLDRADAVRKMNFAIPGAWVGATGTLRLMAEPVGTRAGRIERLTSPTVSVSSGQVLIWTVESTLHHTLEVR